MYIFMTFRCCLWCNDASFYSTPNSGAALGQIRQPKCDNQKVDYPQKFEVNRLSRLLPTFNEALSDDRGPHGKEELNVQKSN